MSATQGGAAVNDVKDFGADAEVNINGVSATTNGLQARVSSEGFDVSIMLDAAFAGALDERAEVVASAGDWGERRAVVARADRSDAGAHIR